MIIEKLISYVNIYIIIDLAEHITDYKANHYFLVKYYIRVRDILFFPSIKSPLYRNYSNEPFDSVLFHVAII